MKRKIGKYMIRDWHANDAASIVKYANNRNIWLNLRDAFPHPYKFSDAENFLSKVSQQDPRTFFAIADDKEAIGSVGLMIGQDVHRFTAELGYWLAEPFWGKGIMTSAVMAITDYGFAELNLNRIYAEPYTHNLASARLLEKAGYSLEGTLQANVVKHGKVYDQFMYARTNVQFT